MSVGETDKKVGSRNWVEDHLTIDYALPVRFDLKKVEYIDKAFFSVYCGKDNRFYR